MRVNRSITSLLTIALLAFLLPAFAQAADEALSVESVRQSIEAFRKSSDYEFAPDTASRAEAYLGAAMLAQEQGNPEDVAAALDRAAQTLTEATQASHTFQKQYHDLLSARQSAKTSELALSSDSSAVDESVPALLSQADTALATAVAAMEKGELNETQQQAASAEKLYRQSLDIMIPTMSAMAMRLISKASSAGAKRYAPQTMVAAKDKAGTLRAYADGISTTVPERPADALRLADYALNLTQRIKELRRDNSSHEQLLLQARDFRMQLATKLNLAVDASDPVADVAAADLVRAIDDLQADLAQERREHREDVQRLKAEYAAELQAKLVEQKNEILHTKDEQLSSMKDAFRAKLERETFEKNRQAKVSKLFKDGEVSILANLDGSLVIRLTGLQFAPNKSKIDASNYDLLARLKQALDIYADRKVRIEGHTDNQGDVKPNQVLSLKRAEAVRDFLIAAKVDGARLKALGYGEVRPIASNDFAKGRAMNRRIDVAIDAPAEPEK
ncbi:MAG TPA: OmpA family protein [Mariprofundaceae bacterium]|nr:OmpA family protein [Mariprofundaceae bacterium]